MVVAFDALGLPAVSGVLQQFLLWLPNLLVGLVVLVIGELLAGALAKLVRGATAEAGFSNPDTLVTVARAVVWASPSTAAPASAFVLGCGDQPTPSEPANTPWPSFGTGQNPEGPGAFVGAR